MPDGKPSSRNAEILIHEQFNVSVILIQTGRADPDTLFTSIETFDEYKDKHQQDYIIYKVQERGNERCKNPAYKSDFIKEVAALITCYDEPSLHEVYLEAVGQIIKPKKAWQEPD